MNIGKVIRIIRQVPRPIVIKDWPTPVTLPVPVPNWPIKQPAEASE